MNPTAAVAEPISGNKLYQVRARAALPLLVRQAEAGVPIAYSDLAEELGMSNARNLNYVLGSIGRTMQRLSKAWKQKVPPIQCLVVNRRTGLPGEGIGWFLVKKEDFASLSPRRQRGIVEAELQHVFAYTKWRQVLATLELQPEASDYSDAIDRASRPLRGGESESHKRLKEYVAANPIAIGLPVATAVGTTERRLPSGDCLDVSFESRRVWVAVEVKSALSPETDILRGLFQCVKYRAIQEAVLLAESSSKDTRCVLVLESKLPPSLIALRNLLAVEVVENVIPSKTSRRVALVA
jgi:hypothetical protein